MTGKFRNIRVKMKGGKSRIQRAMVLASGKLKFVKNLSRSRAASPRHKTTKTHHRIGGLRSMRRRGHRRSGSSAMRSAEKIAKTGAVFADAAMHLMSGGSGMEKGKWILRDYTGFNMDTGKWEPGYMIRGWGPVVGVTIGLKLAHKITGLLQKV